MPREDTGAQTKLFEPVVLAGNGSALDSAKIKQKHYRAEKKLIFNLHPQLLLKKQVHNYTDGLFKVMNGHSHWTPAIGHF